MRFPSFTSLVLVCIVNFGARAVRAQELPLRDISQLPQPAPFETVHRIQTARVAWANYALIRHDFLTLAGKSDTEINAWLEHHSVISSGQAAQTVFNTPVAVEAYDARALRPYHYGRAVVVDTGVGLIDEKGSGAFQPSINWVDGDPRNGNVTLGEALREVLFSEAGNAVLRDAKSDVEVVRAYAAIDTGFDVIHRNAQGQEVGKSPAGILFRQAHTRFQDPTKAELADSGHYFLWNQKRSTDVELIMRRYGLTSIGGGRAEGAIEGGINIQGSRGNGIVDFGNYVAASSFGGGPVTHFYGNMPLLIPGKLFPQPDPAKAIPLDQFGPAFEGVINSKADKPWNWSHETAQTVANLNRRGRYEEAREIVRRHFENMLLPFAKKLDESAQTGLAQAVPRIAVEIATKASCVQNFVNVGLSR